MFLVSLHFTTFRIVINPKKSVYVCKKVYYVNINKPEKMNETFENKSAGVMNIDMYQLPCLVLT